MVQPPTISSLIQSLVKSPPVKPTDGGEVITAAMHEKLGFEIINCVPQKHLEFVHQVGQAWLPLKITGCLTLTNHVQALMVQRQRVQEIFHQIETLENDIESAAALMIRNLQHHTAFADSQKCIEEMLQALKQVQIEVAENVRDREGDPTSLLSKRRQRAEEAQTSHKDFAKQASLYNSYLEKCIAAKQQPIVLQIRDQTAPQATD